MALVIVTGLPRSGTSMMMRMLEAGGLPCLYDLALVDEWNPGGYYEHPAVMVGDWSALDLTGDVAVKVHGGLPRVPHADLRLVVMRRDFAAIRASMRAMGPSTGSFPHGDGYWAGDLRAIRTFAAAHRHVEVWYEDVLEDPATEVLRVARMLGRVPGENDSGLDLAAMAAVADKGLRRHG